MLELALAFLLHADEPGFGGASNDPPSAEAPAAEAPADDACTVKGDDGLWHSCDEVLAKKSAPSTEEEGPVDNSPDAVALRRRMQALEEEQKKAAAESAAGPKKTKLEEELETAKLDLSLPLLQLRIEIARAQAAVDALEHNGVGGRTREEAEARLEEAKALDDEVERIALHRMDVCLQRQGKKPIVKNYKMTAGGPIMLSTAEMIASLPRVDPMGCERVNVVDDKIVAKVKREHELQHILATTEFGFTRLNERKAVEKELADIVEELKNDATTTLPLAGGKDPRFVGRH